MSLLATAYGMLVALGLSTTNASSPVSIDIAAGLQAIWNPSMLLFIQALWLAVFIYTGRSEVTGATIEFHVRHHRV
jgi:hypothetical protein